LILNKSKMKPGSVKTYDIPLMVQRENARPRINNEAFLLEEDAVTRVKMIDL